MSDEVKYSNCAAQDPFSCHFSGHLRMINGHICAQKVFVAKMQIDRLPQFFGINLPFDF